MNALAICLEQERGRDASRVLPTQDEARRTVEVYLGYESARRTGPGRGEDELRRGLTVDA